MQPLQIPSTVQAILFDLSGVLYEGDQAIAGADESLRNLRKAGYILRFITNTASKTDTQLLNQLSAMGFEVYASELYTASKAALIYIEEQALNPYCIVHKNIKHLFATFIPPFDSVLLSDAREALDYAALNKAFQLCHDGKTLIGLGHNRYFKAEQQLQLDAGPFIDMIAQTTEQEAIIIGKPAAAFFHTVVQSTGVAAEHCLMLGDDVFGDIEGALTVGLNACLVQTGKYQTGDEHRLNPCCEVIQSVVDLEPSSQLGHMGPTVHEGVIHSRHH